MFSFDDDISDDDISDALQKVCSNDYYSDYDAMHSVQAAKVVRGEIFLGLAGS